MALEQPASKVSSSPTCKDAAGEMEKRLEGLKRKLQRAVDAEDFERAAELRDQIRAMEPMSRMP